MSNLGKPIKEKLVKQIDGQFYWEFWGQLDEHLDEQLWSRLHWQVFEEPIEIPLALELRYWLGEDSEIMEVL